MVHQPECGTNTPYLIDFIKINLSARLLNSEEIRSLYEKNGLSTTQIAKNLNVSKTVIRTRLREMGVKDNHEIQRNLNPDNYRCPVAPYGYMVRDGKLVPNTKELVICRLVVNLIGREGLAQTETARELGKRGFKTRIGKSKWDSKTIYNIYRRWTGKI